MTKVITLNSPDTATELRNRDAEVIQIDAVGRDALSEAGVEDASAFVVTGSEFSTQIPVARNLNPELEVVLISDDAPDYVRGAVDLILSREIADSSKVADAVLDRT